MRMVFENYILRVELLQVRLAESDGKREHSRRYYSPISKPDDYGKIDLIVRSECQGAVLAQHMNAMKEGDTTLEFRGPSGGFEYYLNSLDYIIAICGGNGVTPAIQIARSIQVALLFLLFISRSCSISSMLMFCFVK